MQNRGRSFPSGGPSGGKFDMGAAGGLSPIAQRVLASQAAGQPNARSAAPVTPPSRPLQLNSRGATATPSAPPRPSPIPSRVPVSQGQNAGYVANGVYGYRATPSSAPQPPQPQSAASTSPTLVQTGGVPATALPTTPTEPTDWGHGNLLLGTSDIPPTPNVYPMAKQPHSHKLLIFLVLLALLAVSGLAAGLWWQQKNHVNPQLTVNQALSQELSTQTYTESLAITKGNSTVRQTRQADFRKLDEPRIYVNNITTDPKQDQVEATVIGSTYYAKKHFSAKELAAASVAQKLILNQINNQWVTVIKSGKPVQDDATTTLNVTTDLQKVPVITPAPLLVGDLHNDQRQQLVDQLVQNQAYTAANGQPTKETVDNQPTWRFSLEVDTNKVNQLNTNAAKLLGNTDTKTLNAQLKNIVPANIALWVRQSDSRIVRYAYALQGTTYDYQLSKLNQSLSIATPHPVTVAPSATPSAPATPATPPPSDDDTQQAVTDIMNVLQSSTDNDSPPPSNINDLMTALNGAVDASELKKFDIQFNSGTPNAGQIFYYTGRNCNDDGSFVASDNLYDYAVASKLSNSLYCKDQVN